MDAKKTFTKSALHNKENACCLWLMSNNTALNLAFLLSKFEQI